MHQLIAQGEQPDQRWRRKLREEQPFVIGRVSGAWSVPWDEHISRQHARLVFRRQQLEVSQLEGTRNPIFFQGEKHCRFTVRPGEHFVIGSTTFSLVEDRMNVSEDAPMPRTEQTYSRQFLETIRFDERAQQLEVLTRLPQVIAGAGSDEELFSQLVNMLFTAIPGATFISVVASTDGAGEEPFDLLHWDSRLAGTNLAVSQRLIRQALEQDRSVVYLWDRDSADLLTEGQRIEWAFCVPVTGGACQGWGIYVAGGDHLAGKSPRSVHDPSELQEDLKFAELVSTTLGSLCDLRRLERHKAALSQFISPVVLEAVADQDPDIVLAPREADVSVLFCDLRGFSLRSERWASDLMGLLNRVSSALGVMTRHILDQGGVVGDFHGDSAMGFWGWPLPQDDAAIRACRAALETGAEFRAAAEEADWPLADFRMGIGIASGTAVAGKIGTVDQVKVTVFGPVVNLAARLQDMTKILRAPILIDEPTARMIRTSVPREEARVRRVARVRPYGMKQSLEASELLGPADGHPLSDEDIASYEAALDALLRGDWDHAFALLHHVPAEDRVKDFLTIFIAQHHRTPPEDWDGVIPLVTKS